MAARHRRTTALHAAAVATAAAACALPSAAAVSPGSAAAAKRAYTTEPGPQRADARFVVNYRGSGTSKVVFHATPPNDGGKPDTNDAHDSSRQTWALRFSRRLAVPTCGQPGDGSPDPCAGLAPLTRAVGPTSMTGVVNHKHVDGLYRQLDRTVKCTLRKATSPRRKTDVTIGVRYIPETGRIGLTAYNPVNTVLSLFPAQCAQQGDSIDRILDFYATPGFSFNVAYGPDRWFTSREVQIPADVFHRSAKITIPFANTRFGSPPKGCAVDNPSYERCKASGWWRGELTLTRKP